MNISRRRWPRGELYAGFFKNGRETATRIELSNFRDPYPTLRRAPELAAAGSPAAMTAIAIESPSEALLLTLADVKKMVDQILERPSAQHKAKCNCTEFYGGVCQWPKCGKPYEGLTFEGVYDIATGKAIRTRLTRKHST
jgi:hypothetical protein